MLSLCKRLKIDATYSQIRYLSKIANKKQPESQWLSVIGLEIHAQIASRSKLFSGAARQFGGPINGQVAYLDAALPGTLPVLSLRCVEAGVLTALALNCHLNLVSLFDRKHYFYADLPAGYQITQQRKPLGQAGRVSYVVPGKGKGARATERVTRITQLQLEQDSGKSLHDPDLGHSLIDLNRAGVGLMEIVTEPDFHSAAEAGAFVRELQSILISIGTCDGQMAEGSLRVDASVSLHQVGEPLGVRCEVKNLNSIRFVTKAIDHEIQRQTELLQSGGRVENETRSFDVETGETVLMRDKEKLHDYRFMPEPNLPPLRLYTNATAPPGGGGEAELIVNVDVLRDRLPELPAETRGRLQAQYELSLEHSVAIVNEAGMVDVFEAVMAGGQRNIKTVVNILLNEILGLLNSKEMNIQQSELKPGHIGELVDLLEEGTISLATVKKVLKEVLSCGCERESLRELVQERELAQVTDRVILQQMCDSVIAENKQSVSDYSKGKTKVFNYLIGQVQKNSSGRADMKLVHQIMKERLLQPE